MRKVFILGLLVMVAVVATAGAILAQDDTSTDSTATAWLGVALAEKNDQVLIARVEAGSPANAADLLIGDVVTAFNGTAITAAADLVAAVQAAAPGDQVKLEVLRNGATVSVDVTLGTTPDFLLGRHAMKGFNLSVDALSAAEMLLHADLQEAEAGFEVVNVSSSRNPFELEEGDVITTINGQAVADLNLETLLSDLKNQDNPELTIVVVREGEEVTLTGSFFGGMGMMPGFEQEMPGMNGRGEGFGRGQGNGMPGMPGGFGGRGGHDGQFPPQSPNDTPDTTPEPKTNGSV